MISFTYLFWLTSRSLEKEKVQLCTDNCDKAEALQKEQSIFSDHAKDEFRFQQDHLLMFDAGSSAQNSAVKLSCCKCPCHQVDTQYIRKSEDFPTDNIAYSHAQPLLNERPKFWRKQKVSRTPDSIMAQRHPHHDPYRHQRPWGRGKRHAPIDQPQFAYRYPQPREQNYYGTQDMNEYEAAQKWAANVRKNVAVPRPSVPNDVLESYTEQLQCVWSDDRLADKKQKGDAVYKKLTEFLKSSPNPWETALHLMTHAADYSQAKTVTLSFTILLMFEKWVASPDNHLHGRERGLLSEDLCKRVFYATTGRYMAYFNLAVKAFMLDLPGHEYFVPMIRALLMKDKLTECAQIVGKLKLQSHFSREEILIPLLLTDKVNVIESYILGNPEQQAAILTLLDHLCARNTDVLAFVQSTGLKNVKGEKLSKKVLSKFAMRLMKLYDIPPEACPNISENRAMGAIRYLLYKRYIEKSIGYSGWDDMVESAIGRNDNLKQQLIMELLGYNDMCEAVKWAERYSLSDSVLDPSVVEARKFKRDLESQRGSEAPVETREVEMEENWEEELDHNRSPFCAYYMMPLPDSQISVVDTQEKLQHCLQRITQPYTTIGIDAEWKPCMGAAAERVALLQLAVEDHVFLLDFMELRNHLGEEEWTQTIQAIFCDEKVLKIGYGLDTDLRMLYKTIPCVKAPLLQMVRVVDVEKLAQKVVVGFGAGMLEESKFDHEGNLKDEPTGNAGARRENKKKTWEKVSKIEEKGLSLLVKQTLGKPLCKGEQMSNWEKRPLRDTQVKYAAMDAYVLLDVYNDLVSRGQALGLSKKELEPPVTLRMKTRMDRKKEKATSAQKSRIARSKQQTVIPSGAVIPPGDLRVVCDTMLQGLGSQLRTCGVDTLIMSNVQRHVDAVQTSKREGRIVLTSGKAYDQIRANVGDRMCYCVPHDLGAREQCLDVLRYFNVKVTKNDIFSRCSACNSKDFATLPSRDMKCLYMYNLQQKQCSAMRGMAGGMDGEAGTSPSLYDIDQETRTKFVTHGIDPATITFLHNGVGIQVETVPKPEVFSTINTFFVCSTCGKVFWEGSHYDNICTQFENILNLHSQPLGPGDLLDEDENSGDEYDNGDDDGLSEASSEGRWVVQ